MTLLPEPEQEFIEAMELCEKAGDIEGIKKRKGGWVVCYLNKGKKNWLECDKLEDAIIISQLQDIKNELRRFRIDKMEWRLKI